MPAGVAEMLRPGIVAAADEMIMEIQQGVPEYARLTDEAYNKALRLSVEEALRRFVDRLEDPHGPWDPEVFRVIGRGEATEGRTLEPFQTALRLGARVGWRRLTQQAEELDLDPTTLYGIGESIFVYLDQLADAAAEGFAEARAHAAGEMERRRHRLLDMLLRQPTAAPEAVSDLAKSAGWRLPTTVAGVALEERKGSYQSPSLPPDVLTGLDRGDPCLIVPNPSKPGQAHTLDMGLRGWHAAIGPTVPLSAVSTSLRWAREALELSKRGVLPERGVIRCSDHMATLLVFKDEELVSALAAVRLAPLAHLRPGQQNRLAETLLAWLRHGRGASEVAARLHVHPQTVRYRLRQIEELYGDQLGDPDIRFELEIVLRARQAHMAAGIA